jgi:hypothetical protein
MSAFHGLLRGAVELVMITGLAAQASAVDKVDYNRDVRPILSDHCFACHGPDKKQRKADLRLDIRDVALAKGAIVPGKVDESELCARILATDPDEMMPPPRAQKPLTAAQVDVLKRWVASGAPYAAHWSYTPIVRPPVPDLKDRSKVHNPIDAFVQAMLERRRIAPAPQADRRTLIRRLSLDLVGLPPTPEEVRAFLDDQDPRAYENLVTRLLGSPHYGERMAGPWLDVVRYADTVGFHGDQNQNAWAYRDYVIDAFNKNLPFDRFTAEQLAGDLLPDPTPEQLTATCFNRLNMMTREGGAQPREYLAKYAADRVRTVGMAWLGSTLGCCECHDHKFDPFTTRDFYSLAAFFSDVKQWGVYHDYEYTPNPDLKGYSNDHPFPPEIVVESPALARRIARLQGEIGKVVNEATVRHDGDPQAKQAFASWLASAAAFLRENPTGWESPLDSVGNVAAPPRARRGAAAKNAVRRPAATGSKPTAVVHDDGRVAITAGGLTNDEFRLHPTPGRVSAIRVELLADDRANVLRPGVTGATLRFEVRLIRQGGANPQPLAFRAAAADRFAPRYANGFEVLGVLGGWNIDTKSAAKSSTAVWLLEQPALVRAGDTLTVILQGNPAALVRVSLSPFAPGVLTGASDFAELTRALLATDAASSPVVRAAYLRATAWDEPAFARVVELEAKVRECRGGRTPVMVTEAIRPMTTRVFPRGNWQDESGPVVVPAVMQSLPQPKAGSKERLTRLDLARWLTSKENPLTARAVVNRLWKQFFGSGLSAQVDDLGAQGDWPVHAELLDWLASEFRESGWDIKHIVRLMITSYTYRQDSNPRPEVFAVDPSNRLLASQSPRRLDAEFIRDNALSIAGLIDLEVGGPPSFPYQPPNYYANLQFPDRDYVADQNGRQYRRGVYSHWQRTFLHPMLAAFDAPSREDCVAARTAANSPQQALALLNDSEFVETARALAARLLSGPVRDDASRLGASYERALSRPPTEAERRSLMAALGRFRDACRSGGDDPGKLLRVGIAPVSRGIDPSELAAWTQVCRVILNLHETITRY